MRPEDYLRSLVSVGYVCPHTKYTVRVKADRLPKFRVDFISIESGEPRLTSGRNCEPAIRQGRP
jgi:hypothetical protein